METKKPLTVNEALSYVRQTYGETYHYNTLYAWLTQQKVRGFKRGGQWRIDPSSLDDFFCPDNQNKTNVLVEKAA